MQKALIWLSILSFTSISDVRNEVLNEIGLAAESDPSAEQGRIIGGFRALEGQFPYAAALHLHGEFVCTATIVSNRTILTAAHCVVIEGVLQEARNYYATIGSTNRDLGNRISMSSVMVHPGYGQEADIDDIAFFTTSSPIEFNKLVSPICIAKTQKYIYHTFGTAIGWGLTSTKGGENQDPPEYLHYAHLRVYPQEECVLRYFPIIRITNSQMCAQFFHRGICNGDSGGPLVYESLIKERILIGVASFVSELFGCGSKLLPGVFTRTPPYADWLMSASNDKNICFR